MLLQCNDGGKKSYCVLLLSKSKTLNALSSNNLIAVCFSFKLCDVRKRRNLCWYSSAHCKGFWCFASSRLIVMSTVILVGPRDCHFAGSRALAFFIDFGSTRVASNEDFKKDTLIILIVKPMSVSPNLCNAR